MPRYAYERLTALDNSFLVLEKPNAYMHVASTMLFEAGPLKRPDGGIDADQIRAMIGASLHQIPRYRQRLAWIPFENHAVWVDDENFQLEFHVRHTSLPRPGSEEQLKRLSARVMQQHLDRSRPLWEIWIVEGIEKDRFALISKVHHCMVDGVSGVDLMKVLMSLSPDATVPAESPRFMPRPAPSAIELMRHVWMRRASFPLTALRDLRRLASEAQDTRQELFVRLRAAAETLGATLRSASPTPLNRPIGPHRRFDWMAMELADVKVVRKALRRVAERRGAHSRDGRRAALPRAPRRARCTGSTSASWRPSRCARPTSRGRSAIACRRGWCRCRSVKTIRASNSKAIAAQTAQLKDSKSAVGAEVLTGALEWTPSQLLALGARNATRLLAFQHGGDERAGSADPDVHGGRADARRCIRTCR